MENKRIASKHTVVVFAETFNRLSSKGLNMVLIVWEELLRLALILCLKKFSLKEGMTWKIKFV